MGPPGVDVDGDFSPYYVVPADKKKHVARAEGGAEGRLRSAAGDRPRSRRRVDQLAPAARCSSRRCRSAGSCSTRSPKRRSTRRSQHARDVNENLVRAQESRRILDRLYGYTLSPVLWKKVQTGLSAGRVQSVAVRLIVEREEERRAFRTGVYWDLEARLTGEGREFVGDARPRRRSARRDRQGLRRSDGRTEEPERPALDEAAAARARRGVRAQPAVDGHGGRARSPASSGRRRPSRRRRSRRKPAASSVSRPSGRCRSRSGCSRAWTSATARWKASSPITAPTRRRCSDKALNESARVDSRDVRRRVLRRPAPVSDEGEERAGSARGDPPDRLPPARRSSSKACSTPTSCGSTS